jgi:hypothetical protein
MFQAHLNFFIETMFRIQKSIIEKFSRIVCVCWKIYSGWLQIDKNFFRQKKCHKKSFWRKFLSQIFFQISRIKKNLKILENIFLDFSFSKKQ